MEILNVLETAPCFSPFFEIEENERAKYFHPRSNLLDSSSPLKSLLSFSFHLDSPLLSLPPNHFNQKDFNTSFLTLLIPHLPSPTNLHNLPFHSCPIAKHACFSRELAYKTRVSFDWPCLNINPTCTYPTLDSIG